EFTHDGKFIKQIGKPGDTAPNSLSMADFAGVAMMSFDPKTNEAYVADGYRNHRVAVIDMTTGAIKRFWGAYGNKPDDAAAEAAYAPDAPPAKQFGVVRCAELSHDGLVYVCDAQNDRVQVFKKSGEFVKENSVAPHTLGAGSVWDIAFSRDPVQKFDYKGVGPVDANARAVLWPSPRGRR